MSSIGEKMATLNLGEPTTTEPEHLEPVKLMEFTKRTLLIMNHISRAQDNLKFMNGSGSAQPSKIRIGFQPTPKVDLVPQNRIYLEDLYNAIGMEQLGKFLVGRVLVWPYRKKVAIELVVEDGRDPDKAAFLSLYNYDLDEVFEPLSLPRGSVILLKNPIFTRKGAAGIALHCDNPSDIERLSPTDAAAWGFHPDDKISSLCANFLMGEPQPVLTHNWRVRGNRFFQEKNFFSAIRAYTEGLNAGSTDDPKSTISLLTNRAMAFLNVGRPGMALRDAEACLHLNPQSPKAIYRKAVALCRTNKHRDAFEFLIRSTAPLPPEVMELKDFIKRQLKQRKRNWTDVMMIPPAGGYLNHMQYTGPVKITQIPGKGRGLIATSKIQAKEVILVSRAFEIVTSSVPLLEDLRTFLFAGLKPNERRSNCPTTIMMVNGVANRLRDEPSLRKEFYKLSAGTKLGYIEDSDGSDLLLDMERIERICLLNSYGGEREFKFSNSTPMDSTCTMSCGIWILPSFLNHSCSDYNAKTTVCGDFQFVMAYKDIEAGDEITSCYVADHLLPASKKEERRKVLEESYEFTCNCSICK